VTLYYIYRCDGCQVATHEWDGRNSFMVPAGWRHFTVKSIGYKEQDVTICPACWDIKNCREVLEQTVKGPR
jgi:hypothetical protein